MKSISSKLFGALIGASLFAGVTFLNLTEANAMDCDNQFMKIEDLSRFRSFQVESSSTGRMGSVDIKFQTVTRINGAREIQLINREGKVLQQTNIDDIVRDYGDVLSVHVSQFWHGSDFTTNYAVAIRGPYDSVSGRWFNSRYLLKNDVVILRTEQGLHFYQIYGQGRLGHWESTKADADAQIHVRTINFWSKGVQTLGTLTQVLEIRDSTGVRYFSPQFRRMLNPIEIGPIENVVIR